MAPAVAQEGALEDDFLIWRFASERARQAAEAARARAESAAVKERTERRGLRGLTPMLERAVRSLNPRAEPRRPTVVRPVERKPAVHLAEPEPVERIAEPAPVVRIAEPAPAAVIAQPRPLIRIAEPVATPRTSAIAIAPPAVAPRVIAPVPAAPAAVVRAYPTGASPAASLEEVLSRGATVPLGAALLVYDDLLEALQRLHASGTAHGDVGAATIAVDEQGRCSLRDPRPAVPGLLTASSPAADVNAAAAVLVEILAGGRANGAPADGASAVHLSPLLLNELPVPARRLVEETLLAQAGLRSPSAATLRQDLAVAATAFLGADWEAGARAWLAAAAYASCAAQREREAAARASIDDGKRPLLFGGVKRRESRILIGVGIAASASVTLVVGAAVGITSSRNEPPHPATRASISAPAPRVVPSLPTASAASLAPSPSATASPTSTPALTAPPVPARAPAPVTAPTSFQPVAVPPVVPTLPQPTPTPSNCLLGIIC